MKMLKSIIITLLCALAILGLGYAEIILGGERILRSSAEPEPVTMTGNISNLFYSRLEDDIQLYPWNYYPENGEVSRQTSEMYGLNQYDPYLETSVFYTLIALAADVESQEVSRWYDEQEKTIIESMVMGVQEENSMVFYFYDDVIRLNGKEYQVKMACDFSSIISFSCIPCRAENVKETEQWDENKETFMTWVEDNPGVMVNAFSYMAELYYGIARLEDWYWYVDMYAFYLEETNSSTANISEITIDKGLPFKWNAQAKEKGYDSENMDIPIQMIELKDSMLLIMEAEVTLGLYYDVEEERIIGFHFFYE